MNIPLRFGDADDSGVGESCERFADVPRGGVARNKTIWIMISPRDDRPICSGGYDNVWKCVRSRVRSSWSLPSRFWELTKSVYVELQRVERFT